MVNRCVALPPTSDSSLFFRARVSWDLVSSPPAVVRMEFGLPENMSAASNGYVTRRGGSPITSVVCGVPTVKKLHRCHIDLQHIALHDE